MDTSERNKILHQLIWDYNIPSEDIDAVIKGKKISAGHYTREMLFQKMIESYPWFTILQLFKPAEIKTLLTSRTITKLRSPSLRLKYEFVQKRLREVIPTTG
jgi:hypothetical protein